MLSNFRVMASRRRVLLGSLLVFLFLFWWFKDQFDEEKVQSGAAYFRQRNFGNKDDFYFVEALGRELALLGEQASKYAIIIFGLNTGQLAHSILDQCRALELHGFEIQTSMYQEAVASFQGFPAIHISNIGISDVEGSLFYIGGGEGAGIFENTPESLELLKGRGWTANLVTVRVTTLAAYKKNITRPIIYTAIDTEGHEPCVIMGMGLQHEENRRAFPAFQIELGGTWARLDPRHPIGSMTQEEIANFLSNRGYKLYMMGSRLLPITPIFFSHASQSNEGFGPFIQGNLLAVHPSYADKIVLDLVRHLSV